MYEENDDDSKENDADDEFENKLKEEIERARKNLASLENRLKKYKNKQLLGRKKK